MGETHPSLPVCMVQNMKKQTRKDRSCIASSQRGHKAIQNSTCGWKMKAWYWRYELTVSIGASNANTRCTNDIRRTAMVSFEAKPYSWQNDARRLARNDASFRASLNDFAAGEFPGERNTFQLIKWPVAGTQTSLQKKTRYLAQIPALFGVLKTIAYLALNPVC